MRKIAVSMLAVGLAVIAKQEEESSKELKSPQLKDSIKEPVQGKVFHPWHENRRERRSRRSNKWGNSHEEDWRGYDKRNNLKVKARN